MFVILPDGQVLHFPKAGFLLHGKNSWTLYETQIQGEGKDWVATFAPQPGLMITPTKPRVVAGSLQALTVNEAIRLVLENAQAANPDQLKELKALLTGFNAKTGSWA